MSNVRLQRVLPTQALLLEMAARRTSLSLEGELTPAQLADLEQLRAWRDRRRPLPAWTREYEVLLASIRAAQRGRSRP